MKKNVILSSLIFLLMFMTLGLFAQVGINTDGSQPDPSAMLDVKSAIKGFLPPRVALTSLSVSAPVASPVAVGLLVFNTAAINGLVPGYYFWNGTRWVAVATPQGVNNGEMLYWNGSAWVIIPAGTHGQQLYFCDGVPTWGGCHSQLTTTTPTNITQRSIVSGGNITSDGGSPVVARGVCWSTSQNPTILDPHTTDGNGTGAFTSNITGLSASTVYYIRAYAKNSAGEAYGNQYQDTTKVYSGAPVTTLPALSACPGSSISIPVTVAGFASIGGVALTLHYNSSILTFTGASITSGYPELFVNGSIPGEVTVTSSPNAGITYPDNTVLLTMQFNYAGGSTNLTWFDNGISCQYLDGFQQILNDLPTSSYYTNGQVNETPEVGSPVFTAGATSSRCQGAGNVTYPATAAGSTGITYSLDEISLAGGNSINQGTGTVNFAASWAGTSVVTASAAGCKGPKTAQHTITTNTLLPVSISITPSGNQICAGTSVTFTATELNGGQSPVYQWKVNGQNVPGATDPSYSFIPANGNAVTCVLTSSVNCPSKNPDTSNTVIMEVNPLKPVSVSVTASANPSCFGTAVTYTATPVNGGTSPAYQWNANGVNNPGATNATYSYVPVNNDDIVCFMTSNITCPSSVTVPSNTVHMQVNPSLPVSVSVSASANPVCAGTSVTYAATPVNGGTTPAYQWQVNGANASGATNANYSFIPVNGDHVKCILTSSLNCTSGNPATSDTVTMIVNPLVPVSISVSASGNSVCYGTIVIYTATPVNGGTTPAYQWLVNGINVPGATNPTYSFAPVNNDKVKCTLTSNVACATGNPATSNAITMIINPLLPVSVSVSASANPVCAGTSVTYTAVPVNGGTIPAYQWLVNGTIVPLATSSTYSFVPVNGDLVKCILTSSEVCATGNPATSNTVPMTVNPLVPVSCTITASVNPVCAGSPVIFTATPVNGGTTPAYQWKVDGSNIPGATNATFTKTAANNYTVVCILTSNASCVTDNPAPSNTIPEIVNPLVTVSISITASSNPVCAGTTVTYTATAINGGSAPVYLWSVNGVNVGTNSPAYSYIPANGDNVKCGVTSNSTCTSGNYAQSPGIPMIVNPLLPVSVSVVASANPSCAGATVTYTATPVNGGTAPAYQWFVNGIASGTNSPVYSYIPVANDHVTCKLTSNATCATNNPATSNTVNQGVNPLLPVGVSITASATTVCAGTQVTFTAVPVNGGSAPSYQWKVNGVNAGTNNALFTYTPANADAVTCTLTSNEQCVSGNPAGSNTKTITVTPLLVTGSISANQTIVANTAPAKLTGVCPTNGK